MDAPDRGAAQTGVALAAAHLDPAVFHQALIELLEITGGQLGKFHSADMGDGTGLDDKMVTISSRSDVGRALEFVPASEPGGRRVVLSAAHVQTGMLLLDLRQRFLDLCLDFTEDILDNPLTGFGIAARRAPPLPTAALTLADIALTLCPFLQTQVQSISASVDQLQCLYG